MLELALHLSPGWQEKNANWGLLSTFCICTCNPVPRFIKIPVRFPHLFSCPSVRVPRPTGRIHRPLEEFPAPLGEFPAHLCVLPAPLAFLFLFPFLSIIIIFISVTSFMVHTAYPSAHLHFYNRLKLLNCKFYNRN